VIRTVTEGSKRLGTIVLRSGGRDRRAVVPTAGQRRGAATSIRLRQRHRNVTTFAEKADEVRKKASLGKGIVRVSWLLVEPRTGVKPG